jgi:hypothetical protein
MTAWFLGAAFVGFVLSVAFGIFGQAAARAAKVPLGGSYRIGAAGAVLPVLLMGGDASSILGYLAAVCHLAWRFARDSTKARDAARFQQQEQRD